MKTRITAILIVAACALPAAGDTTRILDRDYGPLVLPPDAQPGDLERWAACSQEEQGTARSALRYIAPWGSDTATAYVEAVLDGARWECLEALLAVMGAEVVSVEPERAVHLREVRFAGWSRVRETDQPMGYQVTYRILDPARGRPTVWGLQTPPPAGTPWYLDGAPAFARVVGADSPD